MNKNNPLNRIENNILDEDNYYITENLHNSLLKGELPGEINPEKAGKFR